MEELFNIEAKEGWIFAADAARITDERASSEDRKHTKRKEEEEKEKKGRKSDKRPRTRQVLGKSGRLLFLFVLMAQNWLCVNAAAEGSQKRMEITERWQHQEVQVKESRWVEEIPQRWRQPEGEDRTEAKMLRCTLLNGSPWSTEKKYMRRYKGKCDIFFLR